MKSQQYYPYSTIYTLKITWTIRMQKKTIWEKGTFVFHIVNFPFLDDDVPLVPSYGVYISQFIVPFARICNNVSGFNNVNLVRTEKKPFTPNLTYLNLLKIIRKGCDLATTVYYFRHVYFARKYNLVRTCTNKYRRSRN
jgi:hypothetical protein